jgi:RHS repeat-associated protein
VCAIPATPFGAFSAWRSPASGLIYLRNRWYDPALGEFIAPDPIGYGDSLDPYAYCGFDPINRRDPFGTESLLDDIKGSLNSWSRGVQSFSQAAGDAIVDVGTYGAGSGFSSDLRREAATIVATVVSTALEVGGEALAIGPALVVAGSEVPELVGGGASDIYHGLHGEGIGGLDPGERVVVGTLKVLQGLGQAADVVLFVEGASTALKPRLSGFTVGEVKPLNQRGIKKVFGEKGQAESWNLKERARGDVGLVQYERETGDVWLQRYRYDPPTDTWLAKGSDHVGRIKIRKGAPTDVGLAVEDPIRKLVQRRTGTKYKRKKAHAHGPDLVPTGRLQFWDPESVSLRELFDLTPRPRKPKPPKHMAGGGK